MNTNNFSESVAKAITADGSDLRNRKLRVDRVRRNIEQYNPKSVYVTNI
jgi:hypothetical protein